MNAIHPITLADPPVVSISDKGLTIWRFDDGSVVLRLGSPLNLLAQAILVEAHQMEAVIAGLVATRVEG